MRMRHVNGSGEENAGQRAQTEWRTEKHMHGRFLLYFTCGARAQHSGHEVQCDALPRGRDGDKGGEGVGAR